MEKQYKKELTYAGKSNKEVVEDFLKKVGGNLISEDHFSFIEFISSYS